MSDEQRAIAGQGQPVEEMRSGGLLQPALAGFPHSAWFACPEDGCRYQERAWPDGSLEAEFCPVHDQLLVRIEPAPGS